MLETVDEECEGDADHDGPDEDEDGVKQYDKIPDYILEHNMVFMLPEERSKAGRIRDLFIVSMQTARKYVITVMLRVFLYRPMYVGSNSDPFLSAQCDTRQQTVQK